MLRHSSGTAAGAFLPRPNRSQTSTPFSLRTGALTGLGVVSAAAAMRPGSGVAMLLLVYTAQAPTAAGESGNAGDSGLSAMTDSATTPVHASCEEDTDPGEYMEDAAKAAFGEAPTGVDRHRIEVLGMGGTGTANAGCNTAVSDNGALLAPGAPVVGSAQGDKGSAEAGIGDANSFVGDSVVRRKSRRWLLCPTVTVAAVIAACVPASAKAGTEALEAGAPGACVGEEGLLLAGELTGVIQKFTAACAVAPAGVEVLLISGALSFRGAPGQDVVRQCDMAAFNGVLTGVVSATVAPEASPLLLAAPAGSVSDSRWRPKNAGAPCLSSPRGVGHELTGASRPEGEASGLPRASVESRWCGARGHTTVRHCVEAAFIGVTTACICVLGVCTASAASLCSASLSKGRSKAATALPSSPIPGGLSDGVAENRTRTTC